MAANAKRENEIYRVDSVPPPPDEEGYCKPTTVRTMPPNLIALLKKKASDQETDSELAEAADLAELIASRPLETMPPASGVVTKTDRDESGSHESVRTANTIPAPPTVPPQSAPRAPLSNVPRAPLSNAPRAPLSNAPRARLGVRVLGAVVRPRTRPFERISSNLLFALVVFSMSLSYALVTWLMHLW
jgi:hypothetical protein